MWIAYQIANKDSSPEELKASLIAEFENMGGKMKEIEIQKRWEYFPDVKTADLHDGFHQISRYLNASLVSIYLFKNNKNFQSLLISGFADKSIGKTIID